MSFDCPNDFPTPTHRAMISLNLLCASGTAARHLDRAQRDMPNNANLHITEYLNRIPIDRGASTFVR